MTETYNEAKLLKTTETEAKDWVGKNVEIHLCNKEVVKGKIEKVEFSASEPDSELGCLWVSVGVNKKTFLINQIESMSVNND